jgi:hypothetical protein
MKPSDCDEIPLCKTLYFVRGTDYWQIKEDGDAQYIREWLRCEGRLARQPYFYSLTDRLRWSGTMSQNCGHQRDYCSSLGWMWAWITVVMMQAGDNSWLAHHSSLAVLPSETSGASRRSGRRSKNFAYQYLKYIKGYLTCRKILRHGANGFTSHPKEGVLRIFIALKNPSPRPSLNPRPLSQVANTLTTTPPRRLNLYSRLK